MAPSTPSSASGSPRSEGSILTPGRKVKALLAQFDDSDSDQNSPNKIAKRGREDGETGVSEGDHVQFGREISAHSGRENEDSDDAVLPRGPKGRLAAQMQTTSANNKSVSSDDELGAKAYARIKQQIAEMSRSQVTGQESTKAGSSDDELQQAAPRRRLVKKHRTTPSEDHISRQGSRSPSPLFFPSPSAERSQNVITRHSPRNDSDSEELPENPSKQSGSRFLALVEKHRKQRLAREAAEEAKRAARLEQLKKAGARGSSNLGVGINGLSDDSDVSDAGVGTKLTQQARPTRKASKKALEEMNRETQRMNRSMQLAHQAKTKKKITKESLLARFNFGTTASSNGQPTETVQVSATSSSAPVSDVEGAKEQKTPPTSPLISERGDKVAAEQLVPAATGALPPAYDAEFPTMEDTLVLQPTAAEKGKGKAVAMDEVVELSREPAEAMSKPQVRPIKVKWSKEDAVIARGADSDSDLEIVTANSKVRKYAVFERLLERKGGETKSHLILRSLAQLQSASTDNKHSSMNAAEMEAHLRRAARLQVRKEREEKLDELRSRGIIIQSAEDRQKEQQEVEDLVEQAREEAAKIQRREKEMAKKDGTFVKDEMDDDDSEDEEDADFQDDDEEADDQLSGSEEEEGQDNTVNPGEGKEMEAGPKMNETPDPMKANLIDHEADDTRSEEESEDVNSQTEDDEASEKENRSPKLPACRRRALVISDDEDEENHPQQVSPPREAKTPQSVLRSNRKVIPGLQMSDDLPIGLTQAFAATMADSATQEQDSLILTRDLPSPQFAVVPSLNQLESLDIITDSQPATQTQPLNLDLSLMPSQAISLSPAVVSSTQYSFVPTQDVGYVMSPLKGQFDTPSQAPHSTIDTVIIPQEEQSPTLQRRGRLRRGRATVDSDEEGIDNETSVNRLGLDKSAFAAMQRVAKTANLQEVFDKSKSHAKEVVDEAAEESEDEYAGLGGASDDDEGEEDEADRQMIDYDEKLGQGDEGKLAGFYA